MALLKESSFADTLSSAFRRTLQISEYFFGVALGLHFVEDVFDIPIRPNDKRGPGHAHHFLAVHVLLLDDAVRIGNFLVGITQERKWQVEFIFKFLECFGFIGRNPKNHRATLFSFFMGVAKL